MATHVDLAADYEDENEGRDDAFDGGEDANANQPQKKWAPDSDEPIRQTPALPFHSVTDSVEVFHTTIPKFRIDGAPPGHLYRELTSEINPDFPLLDDWGENIQVITAENGFQRVVSLVFRFISRLLYPFALIFNEIIRLLGYVTYYFIVKPFQSLTELVLKPALDTIFYMMSPIITFVTALLVPFIQCWKGLIESFTTCCSTIAAAGRTPSVSVVPTTPVRSRRSSRVENYDDIEEEEED